MVRVERLISAAIVRMDPPAWWASRTAARISASASATFWAAVWSRLRCAGGMVEGFRPGLFGTPES